MRTFVALLLLVVVASAELAPLLSANSPTVIPGSYIVVLKEGLEAIDRDIHVISLTKAIEATNDTTSKIGFLYEIDTFIGFSAQLSEELLKSELADPDVKYIEADQMMSINYEAEVAPNSVSLQTGATWGLARVSSYYFPKGSNATTYRYESNAGSGVNVYVLDTGILTSHSDFGGRASTVFNAITAESSTDLNGHGTHCAGTIGGAKYGIAKKVNLFAVKVLDAKGSGANSGVIAGINYVTKNRKNKSVASMSLGGSKSTSTNDAVAASVAAGVVYAVAAGNDNGDACNGSPGSAPSAITVGSTEGTSGTPDKRSSFSNYGTCVSIFAPGTSITSDWIGSSTATKTISGTSMATPHVAGVLAIVLNQNTATPAKCKEILLSWATSGLVTNPGSGSPNKLLCTVKSF